MASGCLRRFLFDAAFVCSKCLELLGLSAKGRAMLSKYAKGDALPEGRDTLDRVGWLLAIHKVLRLLYPQNPEFATRGSIAATRHSTI